MHHARSEGAKTRDCDAEPLARSRSSADSAAIGEVNPPSCSEASVAVARRKLTPDVDGPFEWSPSSRPPAASATTATAAMTVHIGPRMVDSVFDMAWPDWGNCQPLAGAASVWLKRLSSSGCVGADGDGAHEEQPA